jgi:HAE1 family hydrophobic/amphiphilic exporter-1
MSLPELCISRRVTTIMVMCGIVFIGLISGVSLPQELFPRITFPQITVVTNYTNAAPEEIETLITKSLEEAISSTPGLRRLESVSQEGTSTILASFGWNENVDFAALAVREKIDLVKEKLPKEADDPVVLKFDPLSRPIMILSVTGKVPPTELKSLSEHLLKESLEKVEGVASVRLSGGLDREIHVELDQGRLQSAQISILDVVDSIDNANISYPAGSIKKGLYEYLIRTVGEFRKVLDISYTVVATDTKRKVERQADTFVEKGSEGMRETVDTLREERNRTVGDKRLVMVRDIGEVKDGFHERTTISRYGGKENISIAIQKQGSANTVQIAERLKRELKFLKDDLDSRGILAEIVYDQSKFIKQSIANVRDSSLQGGVLAGIVLFLFFQNLASALIVAVAIPISVIGTFFCFQMQGITFNMISLFGLALGASSVIDNGIVVIENIFRLREQGMPPREAAIQGANEVFWPVFTGSATTIASFFPMIVFIPGVVGQLFQDLAWAVIYITIIAFFVSVTLVPMLAATMAMPKKKESRFKSPISRKNIKVSVLNRDRRGQNKLFRRIVFGGFGLFLLSFPIFNMLDTEVMPKIDQGQFMIKVNLPVGSLLEATDEVARVIEDEAAKIPEVESVSVTIGSAASSKAGDVSVSTLRSHQSLILMKLKSKRKRSSAAVVSELRENIDRHRIDKASIEYVLQESEFEVAAGGGKPIVVEIKGYDLIKLSELAREVEKVVKTVPGSFEAMNDIGESSPETKVEIDRRRASLFAVSARDIALTAKAAIEGAIATKFKEGGREIDVRVRLQEKDRKELNKIGDLLVRSHSLDTPVPLKEVGNIKQGYGPSEIRRKDQIRTVTVSGGIKKGFKEKDVLAAISKEIQKMSAPPEYTIELVGKAREVRESFRRVYFAIGLALVLNYMIMAAQFESFLHPLIVMFTVPLSMVGVAVALFVTGTSINVISLLGIFILAGSGTNNAIVLVDFINERRRDGIDLVEACIDACFIRFRPIMMSMITAVVGLIPLALGIGEGSELQAPLAVTIIGGLAFGTIFTLCVIPAFYIITTRAVDRVFNLEYLEEEGP